MAYYFRLLIAALALSSFASSSGFANDVASTKGAATAPAQTETTKAPVKPFRTWIAVQRYNMESNGDVNQPISNVRLEVTFPNGQKVSLPENGQYWPIGNGQVQEINRTFEVPWAWISNDGFVFTVQMVRKGTDLLPCRFEVSTLSQFNRAYVCKTDTGWQANNGVPPEKFDKESIQVRVFTDLNSKPNEIPNDAIALK